MSRGEINAFHALVRASRQARTLVEQLEGRTRELATAQLRLEDQLCTARCASMAAAHDAADRVVAATAQDPPARRVARACTVSEDMTTNASCSVMVSCHTPVEVLDECARGTQCICVEFDALHWSFTRRDVVSMTKEVRARGARGDATGITAIRLSVPSFNQAISQLVGVCQATLRELSLHCFPMDADVAETLVQAVRDCAHLERVNIGNTTEGAVAPLITALQHCPRLRALEIVGVTLGETDVIAVTAALPAWAGLHTLSLEHLSTTWAIDARTLRNMYSAVCARPRLHVLRLVGTMLCPRQARALVAGLHRHKPNLAAVRLTPAPHLGVDDVTNLVDALVHYCTNLRHFHVKRGACSRSEFQAAVTPLRVAFPACAIDV